MGKRILVVEDDDKSRKLLVDVLGFHGFVVAAFSSGEPAIEDARASRPQAALLDIQLPGLNGFQILTALRADAGASLPVLAVTASVMDHDRRKILDAGFDAYVAKPVNIRELLATLNALLLKEAQ
jgi:two-component system, cell cycle response regulator DivK